MSETDDLRQELRERIGDPLSEIEARLMAEVEELNAQLTEARAQLAILRRMTAALNGSKPKLKAGRPRSGGHGQSAAVLSLPARVEDVRNFLGEHRDDLDRTFTASDVRNAMAERGHRISPGTVRAAIDVLHDRDGFVVADHIGVGGHTWYRLTSEAADGVT